jgi:hypothetical protein
MRISERKDECHVATIFVVWNVNRGVEFNLLDSIPFLSIPFPFDSLRLPFGLFIQQPGMEVSTTGKD